ncbi:MAG: SDR family oxidoreductase [Sphingobium sp.]|nr:MAG: SDR family oxidoreductase [Sphingobium sp.]
MTTVSQTDAKGTALITGASTGIGAIYADRFARRGYDLILVARDKAKLTALAERLAAETGRSVEVLAADLLDPAQLATVEARLRDDPAITLLLNNAGMATTVGVLDNDPDAYDRLIRLNVLAPTRLTVAAAPGLVARGGAIINLSSVLALAPEMFNGVYSGTKAHILNFSQSLAADLGPKGVYVQAVLPGATRTEIWERAGHDVDALPADWVMDAQEMVDAALLGFDRRETVTIPPLEEIADFDAMNAIRQSLGPKLSRARPASRYRAAADA